MQLVQLSSGKQQMPGHFISLHQTECFFPKDTLHQPGALGVTVEGSLALAGMEQSTLLSPSPTTGKVWGYGAKPRARVSAHLPGHRSHH